MRRQNKRQAATRTVDWQPTNPGRAPGAVVAFADGLVVADTIADGAVWGEGAGRKAHLEEGGGIVLFPRTVGGGGCGFAEEELFEVDIVSGD